MKISWAEAGCIKSMSKFLKIAILLSQVLMPIIHAYKNISVTLDHSYTDLKGSVYVSADGKVAKVCSSGSDWKIASVVCRQLGHGPPIAANSVYDTAVSGFYYEQNFNCQGKERSLSECYYNSFSYFEFCTNLFLEVECLPNYGHDFDVHLVSGTTDNSYGIVLVFYGGRWGTVCSYSDDNMYDAICKGLWYSGGSNYYNYDDSVQSYEDPVLDIYGCDYWDSSLDSCTHTPRYSSDSYCMTVSVACDMHDSSTNMYDDTTSADSMDNKPVSHNWKKGRGRLDLNQLVGNWDVKPHLTN
ncbi:hypothetical protein HOLleu_13013 [Holothuria leucospilota]|uniref:SRCR domain-containing protein n=1 Tax=Holothuria leucospilota TaxID=206669 RepID=A0A9Q1HEC6_HOLLE|nr:hypothetical protein HOLleu_13013 [Holothuria leucospilota]